MKSNALAAARRVIDYVKADARTIRNQAKRIAALEAQVAALTAANRATTPCDVCGGPGTFRVPTGVVPCADCRGTGRMTQ